MNEPTRIRFRFTAASGRDYLSDWTGLDASVVPDEARATLLEHFNSGVARGGLITFVREGRKVGIACTAVELVEVLIEGES